MGLQPVQPRPAAPASRRTGQLLVAEQDGSQPQISATAAVIVGRQAVVGRDQRIVGYQLLSRSHGRHSDQGEAMGLTLSGDRMTTADFATDPQVEIDRLVGGGIVICDVEASMLGGDAMKLPPHRTVLRITGSLPADSLEECRRLAERGYRIALDVDAPASDLCDEPAVAVALLGSDARLAEFARVITVDAGDRPAQELAAIVQRFRTDGTELLARGVDTPEAVEACVAAGFDYLQGYAVPSPRHGGRRTLDASEFGPMRLAASLLGGSFEVSELESILRIEPGMTYQLLRLAGAGSDGGMRRQVRTIREALVLVGSVRLQSWVSLLLLNGNKDSQPGAVSMALSRAHMCELLVRTESPGLAPLAFTAGILSAFDLLLGVEMDRIVPELPLDETLREAVFGQGSLVARTLRDVIEFQRGRIDADRASGLPDHQFDAASMKAIGWAEAAAWTFANAV